MSVVRDRGLAGEGDTERRDLVKLAIIEDSELLRAGLRVALETAFDIEVVGEFGLSEEAASEAMRLAPDVVLLGMRPPDVDRSAAICRLIRSASSLTRVLMLSPGAREDEALVSIVSGASGHLSMDVTAKELVHAVSVATHGGSYFEEGIAERVIGRLRRADSIVANDQGPERLSEREQTILSMLAQGLSNSEIAEGLGIAAATVRNNMTRIYDKLGLDSRTKLVRFVLENGVTGSGAVDSSLSDGSD